MSHNPNFVNTRDKFSFHPVIVFHALYTVKLSDKYEKLLKEMCWNDAYLIIGLEDQHVENWHNNATQIYSVVMHAGMVDMHIF